MIDWKQLPDGDEKRKAYYCSREWAERRNVIRKRSGGTCERCKHDQASHTHHLTYARLYNEPLEDLIDICQACHRFVHGHGNEDPVEYWKERLKPPFVVVAQGKVQCPECLSCEDYCHIDTVSESIAIERRVGPGIKHRYGESLTPTSCKGKAIRIMFWCECGCIFGWHLEHHKGQTFFDVWSDENKSRALSEFEFGSNEPLSQFWRPLA